MRIGIYGGTFDPVHFGHLLAAEQCREQCSLDEVWFVPAATPPHKTTKDISPGENRAEMLELAIAGHSHFRVDRRELDREGYSYTVDTLTDIHDFAPSHELFLLLGGDSIVDFENWREPVKILQFATLVGVNRGRAPLDLTSFRRRFGEAGEQRLLCIEMPAMDVSATDIRKRVREGRSIRFMTPRSVEEYINEHGLYR